MAIWAFFIEPNRLIVHEEKVQIENWPVELSGLRIALIGDVHTGSWFIDDRKLQRIVELTNQQQPDLILLAGDYMVSNNWYLHRVEPEVTAAALKNLKAPLGVYAVLGNHDWWYNGEKVTNAFEQNGIRVLENDVAEIKWRDRSFWLAGLSDKWTRPQHISETIAKAPAGATIVAFTHNPDIFPELPSSVPLLLAAHTHGGQVTFPLIGAAVVPSDFGQKYAAGHVYENGHHLFVTTGIGTSILYGWVRKDSQSAQLGSGGLRAVGEEPAADELRRLLRENANLKLENDILKKAAVILGTKAQLGAAR